MPSTSPNCSVKTQTPTKPWAAPTWYCWGGPRLYRGKERGNTTKALARAARAQQRPRVFAKVFQRGLMSTSRASRRTLRPSMPFASLRSGQGMPLRWPVTTNPARTHRQRRSAECLQTTCLPSARRAAGATWCHPSPWSIGTFQECQISLADTLFAGC